MQGNILLGASEPVAYRLVCQSLTFSSTAQPFI